MSTPAEPAGTESAANTRIPIEARPPAPAASAEAADRAPATYPRLEATLVLLLVVLAFFVGSFAAHNSDAWMHLATGRLIARGEYRFGEDPFAYTTTGVRWVNTSWLSDWLGYAIAQAFGGPESERGGAVLVFLKAFLVAGAAIVLLQTRRPGQGIWAGVICTCIALLGMSPRLLLQPSCISYFLLAVTLYLLFRSLPESNDGGVASARPLFLLPIVFALWVNLDSWFLLGPVTVALFLVGEALQQAFGSAEARDPRRLGRLALVLGIGLAACLLNPFHVHVFTLPPELQTAFANSPLRSDVHFQSFYLSPLQAAFYQNANWMPYAGGIGFLALACLGALSFLATRGPWQWWRAAVWLAFLLLALFFARAIPFFAVVAAPITALNLYDAWAARAAGLGRGWQVAGRVVTVVALMVLAALDWAGWLHASGDSSLSHRVAWRLVSDPSMEKAARDLADLRRAGVLQKHGFHTSPDIANYYAWFSPEEKGFLDYRFHLFGPEVAQQFVDIRRALLGVRPAGTDSPEPDAEATLAAAFTMGSAPVDHVVVSNVRADATKAYYSHLALDSERHWTLLRGDGRTEIFGWSASPAGEDAARFVQHKLDPEQLAFRRPLPPEERAPEGGNRPPHPRNLWEEFVAGPPAHPQALGEAEMFLNLFEVDGIKDQQRRNQTYVAFNVFAAVASAPGSGPLLRGLQTQAASAPFQFWGLPEEASSAPLLLAVRAARRAVAAAPEDAQAWLALGQATYVLWSYQRLHLGTTARLNEAREAQIVSALSYAVSLKPDLREAHGLLAQVYFGMTRPGSGRRSHLDLGMEHTKEALRLARAAGPLPGESREDFDKRMTAEDDNLAKSEQYLQQQRDDFELRSKNPRFEQATARAEFALDHGLAKTAIEILERADKSQFSPAEAQNLFVLLLRSGRVDTVREMEEFLGDPAVKLLYALATGDYARADAYAQEIIGGMERARQENLFMLFRSEAMPTFPFPGTEHLRSFLRLTDTANLTGEWADWLTLRGLFALEAGRTEAAEAHFQKAIALAASVRQSAALVGLLSARGPLESTLLLDPQAYTAMAGARMRFSSDRLAGTYLGILRRPALAGEGGRAAR